MYETARPILIFTRRVPVGTPVTVLKPLPTTNKKFVAVAAPWGEFTVKRGDLRPVRKNAA